MGKSIQKGKKIPVELVLTDGYQKRFTGELLKIYEKRMLGKKQKEKSA